MGSACMNHDIEVRQVSPAEYFSRVGWEDIERPAVGTPAFFNSRTWQACWWQAFGERNGLEPCFLEARSGGRLAGKVAFFVRCRRARMGMPVRSLCLLGNLYDGPTTLRSEFRDVSAAPDSAPRVAAAFLQYVAERPGCDELVLQDLAEGGSLDLASRNFSSRDMSQEEFGPEASYVVRIEGSFESYLDRLSGGARRRIMAGRRRLQAQGEVKVESLSYDTRSAAILDRLHAKRWGSPLLCGGRDAFFESLQRELPVGSMGVSVMLVGGHEVSALLNVRVGRRELNLQGGFDPDLAPGVSPARVHWGLIVERAFALNIPEEFDLLVGGGRQQQFKSDFAAESARCVGRRYLRGRRLRVLNRLERFAHGVVRGRGR
jgi:hypothetical protein